MSNFIEFNEDGVAVICPSDSEDLGIGIGQVNQTDGVRAIVLDLTNAVSTIEEHFSTAMFRDQRIPLVGAVSGNVQGWVAVGVRASHICFADPGTVFRFAANGEEATFMDRGWAIDRRVINKTAEGEPALASALEAAGKIATMAPLAVQACLESVANHSIKELDAGLAKELNLFAGLFDTKDMKRGTSAFFEKSKPVFEGN